jgi:hypothetical protein
VSVTTTFQPLTTNERDFNHGYRYFNKYDSRFTIHDSRFTIHDAVDAFTLQRLGAESMTYLLEDMLNDAKVVCTLTLDDSCHPVQKIHACIMSILNQLIAMDALVSGVPALASA